MIILKPMYLGEKMIIKSDRLMLKALTLDELIQLQNKRSIKGSYKQDQAEIGPGFLNAIDIKVEKMRRDNRHHWLTYWVIINAKSNEAMGFIGFKGLENSTAEIGYGISKCFEGHGYMSEAVGCLTHWAFKNGCETVTATKVLRDNYGSQRVLEKNHFSITEDGDTKSYALNRR